MKQKLSIFMGIVFFTAVVTGLSLAEYTAELRNAYDWAFINKITTQETIDQANLYGDITRQSLAKMMVVFSKDMLGEKPDQTLRCHYDDLNDITEDLKGYAVEACQLGIMGQGENNFDPMGKVTIAQFGTILSRALWGETYEGSDPYYIAHLSALQENGILDNISNPTETNITRGEVITALMRSINGIGYSSLALSEDLDDYYDSYDPEIEYLMEANNLSEKEKEVIRGYYKEIGGGFIDSIDYVFEKLEDSEDFDDEEDDELKSINQEIKALTEGKRLLKKNLEDFKKLYTSLNVDLTDTTPYSIGENIQKAEAMYNKALELTDVTINIFTLRKEVCEDGYCELEPEDEEIKNKYKDRMEAVRAEFDRINEEYNEIEQSYKAYIYEYKLKNKYWRDYQESLLGDDLQYNPKNATYISGYLVWEDLTRYKGDIKDGKMEGHGEMFVKDYYYSGEWKNNMWNGFGEFHNDKYVYTGNFRNFRMDGLGVLKMNDGSMTYTGEWLESMKHGKGEQMLDDQYLSGTWKLDEFVNGTIIYPNGVIYEGNVEDDYYQGEGKLTLVSKDIFEGRFEYGDIYGFGKLTLTNGEVYSGEWEDGHLLGESIFIKDGKVILGSKIDIIENQWNDTIVITDGVDTITMMNKNIGAEEVGTGESSYGSFFKGGNNTAFNSLNTGDSEEFIKAGTGVWEEKEQGPCPSGYHVPSANEWQWVDNMFKVKNGINEYDSGTLTILMETFKLPYAGYRYGFTYYDIIPTDSGAVIGENESVKDGFALRFNDKNVYYAGRYWTSTTGWDYYNNETSYLMYYFNMINENGENDNFYEYQTNITLNGIAYPIRCFKD